MENAISARNLSKRYGSVRALDDLTLTVEQGKSFGFLGLNGAGKTTFVKILLDLISADSGTARIFGVDSHETDSRKRVGFLPENMPIYPFLSVEEFLYFHAKLIDIPEGNAGKEIDDVLKLTDMQANRHKKMDSLSKGMVQRTGVAQAILGDPDLLILDEPTSGLDPVGIKELRDIFLNLKDNGKTIFMNSHLLSEVEKTCDTFAILNKGRIIYTTEKSDISEEEKYLEVKLNGLNDDIRRGINSISYKDFDIHDDYLKVYLENHDDSLKVHEIVLRNGGELISLAWEGETLEEVFYRLVKESRE